MRITRGVTITLKVICRIWAWHQINIMVWDMPMARCHNLRDLWLLVNHLPAQNIEVLSIIIIVLILHNHRRHITMIIHHIPNHLCLLKHSSIHPIILMNLIFLLIAGMITMMIFYPIAIQCGNDYIMHVFMNVFCEIYYICIYCDILRPWRMYLCILFVC